MYFIDNQALTTIFLNLAKIPLHYAVTYETLMALTVEAVIGRDAPKGATSSAGKQRLSDRAVFLTFGTSPQTGNRTGERAQARGIRHE